MSQEAMKLALEALEDIKDDCSGCEFEWSNDYPLQAKAKLALEEALAKQEQSVSVGEPVAWRTFDGEGFYFYCSYEGNENYADVWNKRNPNHKGWVEPLYNHQFKK